MEKKAKITTIIADDKAFFRCPTCGSPQDALTGVDLEKEDGPAIPEEGSLIVCSYCGSVNQFHIDRPMTICEDWKEQFQESPQMIELVEKFRTFYKDRKPGQIFPKPTNEW